MALDTLVNGNLPVLVGIIALAYLIRGISGFGSGLIAIPLLALYLPFQVAVPAIAMLDNVAAARHGLQHRHKIAWNEILPLMPVTLVGVFAGVYLLQTMDTEVLQKAMGGFLLLYAGYMLSGLLPERRRSLPFALPFGLAGGVASTLLGTGGPFYVVYLHLRNQRQLEFRATVAMILLVDGAIRLFGYLYSGLLDTGIVLAVLVASPIMLASMRIGGKLHTRLSPQAIQRLVSILLIGSGCLLLLR